VELAAIYYNNFIHNIENDKYPVFIQAYEDYIHAKEKCLDNCRGIHRYTSILLDALHELPHERLVDLQKETAYRKTTEFDKTCSCHTRPIRKTLVYNDPNSCIAASSKGAVRFMKDDVSNRVYIEKGFGDTDTASNFLEAEHTGYHNIRYALKESAQKEMIESFQYPTYKHGHPSISMDKMGEVGIFGWLEKCNGVKEKNETEIRKSIEYIIDQLKMFVVAINAKHVFHCDLHPENIRVTYDHENIFFVTGVFVIDFELTREKQCDTYRSSTATFGTIANIFSKIRDIFSISNTSVHFDISKTQKMVPITDISDMGLTPRTTPDMSDYAMLHNIMKLFVASYNYMTGQTYTFGIGSGNSLHTPNLNISQMYSLQR
jgi:hypothetical protein